ncbi:MAG: HEAT repeat domain-containing protein [Elusimicrobia bacterium]|nr:HEAT repeat domain-containing protein [Elusimicrobiota bacterium]
MMRLPAAIALQALAPALAGAMMLSPDPSQGRWEPLAELEQQAVIDYRGGVERLFLDSGVDRPAGKEVLWVIPVPAKPSEVVVRSVLKMPALEGREAAGRTRANMDKTVNALLLTQPLVLPHYRLAFMKWSELYFGLFSAGSGALSPERLIPPVSQDSGRVPARPGTLLKGGSVAIIPAEGFSEHLRAKGFKSGMDSIAALAPYMGKGFSLVLAAAPGAGAGPSRDSLLVSFPAQRLFFPLLPADPGSERPVRAVVRISDCATPAIGSALRKLIKLGCYSRRRVRYSKIEVHAPAKRVTEDLWLDPRPSFSAQSFTVLGRHQTLVGFALMLLASLAAGLLLGRLVFPEISLLRLAGLALTNCLTGFALILACAAMKTRSLSPEEKAALDERRSQGWKGSALERAYQALDWRKLAYLAFFPAAYLLALEVLLFCLFGPAPRSLGPMGVPSLLSPQPLILAAFVLLWSVRAHLYLSTARDGFVRFQRFIWAVLKTVALGYVFFLVLKSTILLYLPHFVYEMPAAAGFTGMDLWFLLLSIPAAALLLLPVLALSALPAEREPAWLMAAAAAGAVALALASFKPGSPVPVAIAGAFAAVTLACLACRRLYRRLYADEKAAGGAHALARAVLAALLLALAGNTVWRTPNFRWTVPCLVEALKSDDRVVVAFANGVLHKLPLDRIMPAILPALADGRDFVRRVALEVLAAKGDKARKSAAAVAEVLRSDQEPSLRAAAAQALLALRGREGVPPLVQALQEDGDLRVRLAAAWALAGLDQRQAAAAVGEAAQKAENRPIQEALRRVLKSIENK